MSIEYTNNNHQPPLKKNQKLERGRIELSFIKATEGDSTGGLKSAMQRAELFDMIIRMA